MTSQSQVKQHLREIEITPEICQFRIGLVAGFHIDIILAQVGYNAIRHRHKLVFAQFLAVKVQILRESVYSLNKAKVRTANE